MECQAAACDAGCLEGGDERPALRFEAYTADDHARVRHLAQHPRPKLHGRIADFIGSIEAAEGQAAGRLSPAALTPREHRSVAERSIDPVGTPAFPKN
jgi:hypothetical protein